MYHSLMRVEMDTPTQAPAELLDDEANESGSSSSGDGRGACVDDHKSKAGAKRRRRPRPSTYVVRKTERNQLVEELKAMQTQLNQLKRRLRPRDHLLVEKQLRHKALVRAMEPQALAGASLQSLLSEIQVAQEQMPFERFIHLSADPKQRRATLSALKTLKLEQTERFLEHRFCCVDEHRVFGEYQHFDSADGGYCAVQCHVSRIHGAQCLKQVFDSVIFNLSNLEMSLSDHTGNVVIRVNNTTTLLDGEEDDDLSGIAQNRLVSTTPSAVRTENNWLLFSKYCAPDAATGDGESALIAISFVHRDDLYPYQPDECVRKDPSAFCRMTCHPRGKDQPLVVVIERWSSVQLRPPAFAVSPLAWRALKQNLDPWSQTMQLNVVAGMQSAEM